MEKSIKLIHAEQSRTFASLGKVFLPFNQIVYLESHTVTVYTSCKNKTSSSVSQMAHFSTTQTLLRIKQELSTIQ